METVLTDLRQGWTILETANVLAHGANNEGRGYLVTLSNASGSLQHKYYVPRSSEMDALLESQYAATIE